ncbi:MAG: NAD(P)H-dependent oxidoreductase subunit E, partial [Mariprofundaceae bacterium]
HVLRICQGPICGLRGGRALLDEAERTMGGKPGMTLLPSHCLGACDQAPAVKLDEGMLTTGDNVDVTELVRAAVGKISGEDGGP